MKINKTKHVLLWLEKVKIHNTHNYMYIMYTNYIFFGSIFLFFNRDLLSFSVREASAFWPLWHARWIMNWVTDVSINCNYNGTVKFLCSERFSLCRLGRPSVRGPNKPMTFSAQ